MLEEEHYLWIYNYTVSQNILSVVPNPVTRVRKISSDLESESSKKRHCVFKNYAGMIKGGKGVSGLKKIKESKAISTLTADYNPTRIEDVYLAG